jgi:hypothetical protein
VMFATLDAVPSKMDTKRLSRTRADPGLAGSGRPLKREQDGNTRAVHEQSRPVPADPAKSRMSRANGNAGQTDCTVVLAGAGVPKPVAQLVTTTQVAAGPVRRPRTVAAL